MRSDLLPDPREPGTFQASDAVILERWLRPAALAQGPDHLASP
jgi:hypothetical protein